MSMLLPVNTEESTEIEVWSLTATKTIKFWSKTSFTN